MKKYSKLLCLSVLGLGLPFLAGCGNTDNISVEGRLTIVYYPGGYGEDYLHTLCKNFLAEKKGVSPEQIVAGTDYFLQPDNNITYGSDYWIASDERCPDLVLTNQLDPQAVTRGYVANLDSVLNTTVSTSTGNKTIQQFVMKEAINQFIFEMIPGNPNSTHCFAMPWTAIPISIAYNNTLLQKITHVSSIPVGDGALDGSGKWQRAPITVEELKAVFEDCKAYSSTITPFGWAMLDGANWFESLIITWWAQKQGVDVSRYPNEGSYYDFWKYDSENIFKQTGLQEALGAIKDLIVKDGSFINSYPYVDQKTIKQAQQEFALGNALFCLTGDFFEKEYAEYIAQSGQEFKLTRVPAISGAETKEGGDVKQLTYINISSCAFVPNKAKNKDLGKEFLVYTSKESVCKKFSEMIGAIRPFHYDARTIDTYSSFSNYRKSVFDLFYDTDDYLVKFPRNIDVEDVSPIFTFEKTSQNIFNLAPYGEVIDRLRIYSPYQIMVSNTAESTAFESIYNRHIRWFANMKDYYGLNG